MPDSSDAKIIHVCLEVLSPIHLGSDDVYEPTGFVVDFEKDELIVFHPTRFIADLPDDERSRLSEICQKGTIASILELYKFMSRQTAEGRRVKLCSEFKDHYQTVMKIDADNERKMRQELNRFEIQRTAFLPNDGRPYIPGSAVKGALRTAYLNLKNDSWNNQSRFRNAPEMEKLLTNQDPNAGIKTDPFRLVKVSDFMPVGKTTTKIVYATIHKKKPNEYDAGGPYQILETILPGSRFMGSIKIEPPEKKAPIKSPIDWTFLLSSLSFYTREKKREDKELRTAGGTPLQIQDENSALCRLGRHSGAECLTIEGHRSIFIRNPKGKGSRRDGATTLWLASESSKPPATQNLKPFGWVGFKPMSKEESEALHIEEKEWRREWEMLETERLDRLENKRVQAIAEQRRAEEEKLRQEKRRQEQIEAEKKKQAALAVMTPAQKDAAALAEPGIVENMAYDIYSRLNQYDGNEKKLVAEALKTYFQSVGKWKKKKGKQAEKVQEIKTILGETP
jgi:CRISPR-associated protein Csm5